jgi:hypothetical protein
MNLLDDGDDDMAVRSAPPTPVVSIAKEKILEEVRKNEFGDKPVLSLVVVGESPSLALLTTSLMTTQVTSTLASRL